ncbi:ribonuclease H-like domain-containing protein [Tanacetum coccineum]|uniref:Ribonuclease H-like domain-containing protein n=1 Tax=Tanacetum coccineum TaxID=301880 RepID=A0ABQ5CT64_9ASTR
MYENFSAPSTKSLDSIFNRLQKIRNKPDLDTISFDDLYNNFKIVEQEVKSTASSSSSSSSKNMAFVSSPSSTNEVNTAYGVSTSNTQVSPASTQVSTASTQDLEQIHEDDLEEMDLKWQITINRSDTAGYNKSKVECFNCHKMGHFARECRGPRNQDSMNRNQDSSRRTINMEETSSKDMVAIDGVGFDWSYMADDEVPTNMALMAFLDSEFNKSEFNLATYKRGLASVEEQLVFYKKNELEKLKQEKESNQLKIENFNNASKSLGKLVGSQITDKSRKGVGFISYNVVPPPHTGLFSPPNLDLSYSGLEEFQHPEFEGYGPKTSKSVCKDIYNKVRKSSDVLLVKELVSNDKLEKKFVFLTVAKIESVRPKQQEKLVRKPANCNYHQRERVVSRNNNTRVNSNYSAKKAHPGAYGNMVPRAVLMKNGLRSLNTARPVNTAHPKTTVYSARPMSHFSKSAQSTGTCPISSDFKEFNGGYVTFGGGAKVGKITGKGTLKTSKLDFEDVYFVKELQFNLFSVLQMCDKKNSVIFTDTGCFVLSPDFKLADESQVLLKVPRKNNMYSVDMRNIVPKKSLTCLVAKATLDESKLWHRRPGHVNFKTINKIVKENLVRCLPTKRFENDPTCVSCLKGKQHKSSYKFTWVFFLASKDETSGILKIFITEIENLVDKKVKIIRCDNGTKFKNRVMNEFCEKKGIKKEFNVARTPQQNGVVKRRNRTLIEAARTILADSKLPTTFWAEAVNTACYVQNIGLNSSYASYKASYELFRGRTPALSFMRPFGMSRVRLNPQPFSDAGKKDDEGVSKESGIDDQKRPENSTQDVNTAGPSVNTEPDKYMDSFYTEKDVSTAEPVSTAGAVVTTDSVAVSTASPTRNTGVSTTDDITMAETLVYIRKSAAKDKGKGKMAESKTVQTKTKLQQEQERLDFEAAVRLQAELENTEVTGRGTRKYTEVLTKKDACRTYQSEKEHMGGYTLQQLRGYSFDEIKTLFETTMRRVNTFVPIESEVDRAVPELAAGSSKRAAEEELDQESSKRQKTGESSELAEEPRDKEADELSQEELQQMMIIVPEQGMNVEALQTKYPIIDWEIYTEGTRKYWKIIRVRNHTKVHHFFDDMLKAFDRDDLVMLWSLVKEKFNSTEPTNDKEREIWVELKRLFEPDTDDELWKLQKHIHDLT